MQLLGDSLHCGKSENKYFNTQESATDAGYPYQGSYIIFKTYDAFSWWFEFAFRIDDSKLYFRTSVNGTISSWVVLRTS